jgi:cytochrome c1
MVLPALLFGLVACGSQQDSDIATADGVDPSGRTTSATAPSTGDREEQSREFAQCMRDHGIEMSDPQPGKPAAIGKEGEDAKTKAALEACREFMPNGGEPPSVSPEMLEQGRKYAQCMREHGLADFPDPDPDAQGGQAANVDPNDPTFKAADEACKDLRPTQGSGPT